MSFPREVHHHPSCDTNDRGKVEIGCGGRVDWVEPEEREDSMWTARSVAWELIPFIAL